MPAGLAAAALQPKLAELVSLQVALASCVPHFLLCCCADIVELLRWVGAVEGVRLC